MRDYFNNHARNNMSGKISESLDMLFRVSDLSMWSSRQKPLLQHWKKLLRLFAKLNFRIPRLILQSAAPLSQRGYVNGVKQN